MYLRNARCDELNTVYELYRSAVGREFCVWNEYYPGTEEIQGDFETDGLFVMIDNEKIIGACSIVPENELSGFSFWKINDGTEREIARVVVSESYKGRGIAAEMVGGLIGILQSQKCRSVHLSAAASNVPALKTYGKVGFTVAGEADMYGGHYYLLEKLI